MEDLFNFDKREVIKTNEKFEFKSTRKIKRANLRQSTRDDNFKTLIESMYGMPTKNTYLAIKTNGTSDCGSIFSYLLKKHSVIDDMYMATWTISKQNIKRIRLAIENEQLKKLTMIFSSTLKAANPSLYANLISSLHDFDNVFLKEVNSHAKTFSVKIKDDYYTVSGSANWSENPRIENFLILNNKELYNHHKEWMSELTNIR